MAETMESVGQRIAREWAATEFGSLVLVNERESLADLAARIDAAVAAGDAAVANGLKRPINGSWLAENQRVRQNYDLARATLDTVIGQAIGGE